MRENSIKTEYIKIGKNLKMLSILSCIHAVSIINSFGSIFDIIILEVGRVGFNPLVLSFSIINFISIISLLFIYYYQIKILTSFKEINSNYGDISLKSFQFNMKSSIILNIIGLIGFLVSVSIYLSSTIIASSLIDQGYSIEQIGESLEFYQDIINNMMFLLIGSAIGTILEIAAWRKLEEFFRLKSEIFPEDIRQDLIINSSSLIYASAFSFFELGSDLFIPFIGLGSIMGFIYYIIGYRKLGRTLCKLDQDNMEVSEMQQDIFPVEGVSKSLDVQLNKINNKIDSISLKLDKIEDKLDKLEKQ